MISDLDERYTSAAGWKPDDEYAKAIEEYRRTHPEPGPNPFVTRSGPDIAHLAANAETAPPLFGDFWRRGELAIMFADTGIGKSILAVQIAASLARGTSSIDPFADPIEPQKVVYLDFELTDEQFAERYFSTKSGADNTFPENFIRATPEGLTEVPSPFGDLGEYMAWAVHDMVARSNARVLIVDNISFLNTANTNAADALRLMKGLKHLRTEKKISVLVLAHTPKRRYGSPITVNDLQGSKMLANFADNIFAIGRAGRDRDLRYIKHIKARSTQLRFGSDNVLTYRIERTALDPNENAEQGSASILSFSFEGFATEHHMLIRHYDNANGDRERLIEQARQLHAAGHSLSQIADLLNIGKTTAQRYVTSISSC